MTFRRPNPARLILGGTYALATAGLLVIAFDATIYDRVAIVIFAALALVAILFVMVTGYGLAWLAVGGLWVYAAVIVAERGTGAYQRAGLALIFAALAFGALAAYVAYDRRLV